MAVNSCVTQCRKTVFVLLVKSCLKDPVREHSSTRLSYKDKLWHSFALDFQKSIQLFKKSVSIVFSVCMCVHLFVHVYVCMCVCTCM